MKMYGSNIDDTFFGTKKADTMMTYGGNDLIATAGGADVIKTGAGSDMITGFSFDLNNVARSANRGADIDAGDGDHDILIVEMNAARRLSNVDDILKAMKVTGVEEFIYNFAAVTAKQQILGTKQSETIIIAGGDATVDMGNGNDYLYTAGGDDFLKGGKGIDFIHAGEGHNTVSGGDGADYFHFHITADAQYTEITDFKAGEDKILISIDTAQINLLYSELIEGWEAVLPPLPVRGYGDGYLGVGPQINPYVSYNHGREFDIESFGPGEDELLYTIWMDYEQETGSVFINHYETHPEGLEQEKILVAHIKPDTVLDVSDFEFRMI